MIIFFLSLFLFSKEVGVLIVGSTNTISDLCKYIITNNLDLSFSYAGPFIEECMDVRFENVDYLKFPIGVVLNKGEDSIFSNFDNIDFKKNFFDCAYDKYVGSTNSKGFFIEGGAFNLELIDYLPSSYTWIVGSVSSYVFSNLYEINDKYLLSFELVKSTNQIQLSSSSLFLLDEKIYKDDIKLFFKLSESGIKFLRIYDLIYSLSNSTGVFKSSSYVNEFKNEDINYLSYLNRVFSEIVDLKSEKVLNSLCDFFDFYPIDLDRLDEVYDEIRSLTYDIYFISSKNLPLFVYDDFLRDNIRKFYIEKTDYSIVYKSKEGSFTVNVDTNATCFKIDFFAATDDIHIYADINKRAFQGLTNMIGRTEKISDINAWEYALIINKEKVKLYSSLSRDYKLIKEFKTYKEDDFLKFCIPKDYLKGNPLSWCYIVIYWDKDQIKGFFTRVSQKIFGCNE